MILIIISGIPWIQIDWACNNDQWLALDSGITEIVVRYLGGTWTGTMNFAEVDQPVEEPIITYPVQNQAGVALVPLIEWQSWNSWTTKLPA